MNERKTRFEAVIAGRNAAISVREWRVAKPKGQVICLHGFGVNGAEYAPMAEVLNKLDFNVLMPDWIGHGDSEFFGDPKFYEWDSYIKCLGAIVRRHHGPATHYVGTSWGGALLLIFLLSYRLLPQSATFVDVPLESSSEVGGYGHVFHTQSGMTFPTIAAANEFLAKQRPQFSQVPERFKKYFDKERYLTSEGSVAFKFDPAILPAFENTATISYNQVNALQRIRFNALFLYGVASPHRVMPIFMSLCARMPHIRYRDNLRGGHPPMLLHEDQFSEIIGFIKKTNPTR